MIDHHKIVFWRYFYSRSPFEVLIVNSTVGFIMGGYAYHKLHPVWFLIPLLFISGILLWTFLEYCIHRFAFHNQSQFFIVKNYLSLSHVTHHKNPQDLNLVTAGPLFYLPIALSLLFVLWMIVHLLGFEANYLLLIFPGVFFGHFVYEYIHHRVHLKKWQSWPMRELQAYHLLHHHQNWQLRHGVSSPFWDIIFRTYREH